MAEKCEHEKKKTAVTKSGTYLVCEVCGKRLERLDSVVIEKVVVPETLDKTLRWMQDQVTRVF